MHRPSASASRRGRLLGALAAGTLVAAAVAAPASAAGAPAASTCPTGGFAFSSTLSNGSFKIGSAASSTGASATACGDLENVNGVLSSVVKKENVSFQPTQTSLFGLISLPTTVTPTGDLSGPADVTNLASIGVQLSGPVLVTTDILGAKCSFPLTLNMTTGKSGALTGAPLVPDSTGTYHGKLVAGDFTVPKVQASSTCPALFAWVTNLSLGTPLAAGKSTASFDISLKLGG